MSVPSATTSVQHSITVGAPLERAFEVFTDGIGTWFPAEYNLMDAPIAERVFEPRAGGQIIDRTADGQECRWARVLVYEPPHRVVFSWDINPYWQVETDPGRTSEVEVRFTEDGAGRTLVELEHRHLDRHGDGWEQLRDAIAGDGGWTGCLQRFAERMAAG